MNTLQEVNFIGYFIEGTDFPSKKFESIMKCFSYEFNSTKSAGDLSPDSTLTMSPS